MSDFEINPRKTPLKGEPNFTNLNDKKLKLYQEVVQEMIFDYKGYDKDITKVLQKVHKQISDNLTDRIAYDTMIALSSEDEEPKQGMTIKSFKKPKKLRILGVDK